MHTVTRTHEIACGHRVFGHESKCAHLHGHNYTIEFTCVGCGCLDGLGRVIDFGVIKERLCAWLEANWDHRMLLWEKDPLGPVLAYMDPKTVLVPFNPTAENMAQFLVETVGPEALRGTGVVLLGVTVWETSKCCATFELNR